MQADVRAEGLNKEQMQAVEHDRGPLVVFAGAGSGKTRVITHRVAHLVLHKDVRPWRILAVTFTNKAAQEMRERLAHTLGADARDLWVGTFHATCARLLRRYAEHVGVKKDFTIYDDSDQLSLLKRVIKELKLDDKKVPPKRMQGWINRQKQEVRAPERCDPPRGPLEHIAPEVYATYQKHLDRSGALDFGDLIFRLVIALEEKEDFRTELRRRFSHLLVDEFQDTNHVQYRLVRALAAEHRNLCVVGDDDQSIYRWRGADRRNILDFRREFPDAAVVKLERNYRSTQRILKAANSVIEKNSDREPKRLWTDNPEGEPVRVITCRDERDEARTFVDAVQELLDRGESASDIALFYRTHAQSRVFEEVLRAADLPYRIYGGLRFYDRAEVKDLLAYLRILSNLDDDVSLQRVINVPARGIGKTTIDRLINDAAKSGTGLWASIERASKSAGRSQKRLRAFRDLILSLRAHREGGASIAELGMKVLEDTGYRQMLADQDTAEADARLLNLKELLGSIEIFEEEVEEASLESFLERVTLESEADRDDGEKKDRISLMTVHAAKGLEFPTVFVGGLEEELFPFRGYSGGPNVQESIEEAEEERRLAYVAFTRARERLVLFWARTRRVFGQLRSSRMSRFLHDLPQDDIQAIGLSLPPGYGVGYAPPPAYRGPRGAARGGGRGGAPGAGDPYAGYARSSAPPASAPPPDMVAGDSYVDTSEGGDLGSHGGGVGMAVRHPRFGVGRVRAIREGHPPTLTVEFPKHGIKRIRANFLSPV